MASPSYGRLKLKGQNSQKGIAIHKYFNRITANGVYLRHDPQVTDDVAVWRDIAKDTSWVRIRIRFVRSSARWTFATSSIPGVGLQSVSIAGVIVDRFLAFSTGANSSNSVKVCS